MITQSVRDFLDLEAAETIIQWDEEFDTAFRAERKVRENGNQSGIQWRGGNGTEDQTSESTGEVSAYPGSA